MSNLVLFNNKQSTNHVWFCFVLTKTLRMGNKSTLNASIEETILSRVLRSFIKEERVKLSKRVSCVYFSRS